jgi:HAD superfamily hydrolase (TIGR01509 family)
MALDAVIFDLDGTLVDSNPLHVEAWVRAFARYGYKVPPDRIFVEVGKGGDNLVPSVIGKEAVKKDGDKLRNAQPEEFEKLAGERGLKPFPRARELLDEVRRRGLKTVLATSSNKKQLRVNEENSGLKVSERVDLVVNADDIEKSKPAPDLVVAAVKKLGMSPAQCAMVGDTPYDAQSARHAGVVCLGLTCGGFSREDLLKAGARETWKDPADLVANLGNALHVASPGSAHLTQAALENLMREALAVAREAVAQGEAPIGAAIAAGDGTILCRGFNELNRTQDRTAHAEMVAFARCARKAPPDARDLVLVSTLEPCVMCLGASTQAGVDTVLYALPAPADGGTGRVEFPHSPLTTSPRLIGDVLADESRDLFEQWLKRPSNNPEQVKYIRQLLAITG